LTIFSLRDRKNGGPREHVNKRARVFGGRMDDNEDGRGKATRQCGKKMHQRVDGPRAAADYDDVVCCHGASIDHRYLVRRPAVLAARGLG
jgi:hypothetical protein